MRERCLSKIRMPATSGNQYNYYNWAMECSGVGAAKVFPLADGPGTVKIVIADTSLREAGKMLVNDVYEYIEEKRPIGVSLRITSACETAIDITANVRLKDGASLVQVQEEFTKAVESLLESQAFSANHISLARIGNVLLDTAGVEDYSYLTLNKDAGNVYLSNEQIAVAGTVRLEGK